MDASVCTVVILHENQEIVEPYHMIDNEDHHYQQLLKSNFGQVHIQQDPLEAIKKVKQSYQSSLLLVDLDAINYSKEESKLTRHDYIIRFLEKLIRDLNTCPNHIPLIVCSKNDSSHLMLDCIHAGATDYLLKPLYLNVIKTLFLKLHQSNNPPLPSPTSIHEKDSQLSKILMDTFVPKSSSLFNYPNITKKRSFELEKSISSWDFSPFNFTQDELIHSVYLIFKKVLKLPALCHLKLTSIQLYDFIMDLASVYHDENPYHNFTHAVDVLQCLYYMLTELNVFSDKPKKPLAHLLRPQDAFALLIAAIGHDAAHPGVNNIFLINSNNPLATLYNDRSVLESLHSMTLFQLLNKHGIIQLIGDAKSDAYKEFRKIVVSSILATDMALHVDYVAKIKEQAIRFHNNTLIDDESERVLLCSALIKCADISNVARPFRWGTKWAELLVEEFMSQGDLEKELGMPVQPMNDRCKVVLEDSQIGFIQFVALDLFQNVRDILGNISFAVDQMQANLKQWESRKNLVLLETGIKRRNSNEDNVTIIEKKVKIEKEKETPIYCQCSTQ